MAEPDFAKIARDAMKGKTKPSKAKGRVGYGRAAAQGALVEAPASLIGLGDLAMRGMEWAGIPVDPVFKERKPAGLSGLVTGEEVGRPPVAEIHQTLQDWYKRATGNEYALPDEMTASERLTSDVAAGVAGSVPFMGFGGPVLQLVSGATGGLGGGLAREAGFGPVGQFVGGLVGGYAPTIITRAPIIGPYTRGAARRARNKIPMLGPALQRREAEREAAGIYRHMLGGEEGVEAAAPIIAGEVDETVGRATLAQALGDRHPAGPAVTRMQEELLKNPVLQSDVRFEQELADLYQSNQAALAAEDVRQFPATPDLAAGQAAGGLHALRSEAAAEVDRLYDLARERGAMSAETTVGVPRVLTRATQLSDEARNFLRSRLPPEVAESIELFETGQATLRDLDNLNQALNQRMADLQREGDRVGLRLAGQLKHAVNQTYDDLQEASARGGAPPVAPGGLASTSDDLGPPPLVESSGEGHITEGSDARMVEALREEMEAAEAPLTGALRPAALRYAVVTDGGAVSSVHATREQAERVASGLGGGMHVVEGRGPLGATNLAVREFRPDPAGRAGTYTYDDGYEMGRGRGPGSSIQTAGRSESYMAGVRAGLAQHGFQLGQADSAGRSPVIPARGTAAGLTGTERVDVHGRPALTQRAQAALIDQEMVSPQAHADHVRNWLNDNTDPGDSYEDVLASFESDWGVASNQTRTLLRSEQAARGPTRGAAHRGAWPPANTALRRAVHDASASGLDVHELVTHLGDVLGDGNEGLAAQLSDAAAAATRGVRSGRLSDLSDTELESIADDIGSFLNTAPAARGPLFGTGQAPAADRNAAAALNRIVLTAMEDHWPNNPQDSDAALTSAITEGLRRTRAVENPDEVAVAASQALRLARLGSRGPGDEQSVENAIAAARAAARFRSAAPPAPGGLSPAQAERFYAEAPPGLANAEVEPAVRALRTAAFERMIEGHRQAGGAPSQENLVAGMEDWLADFSERGHPWLMYEEAAEALEASIDESLALMNRVRGVPMGLEDLTQDDFRSVAAQAANAVEREARRQHAARFGSGAPAAESSFAQLSEQIATLRANRQRDSLTAAVRGALQDHWPNAPDAMQELRTQMQRRLDAAGVSNSMVVSDAVTEVLRQALRRGDDDPEGMAQRAAALVATFADEAAAPPAPGGLSPAQAESALGQAELGAARAASFGGGLEMSGADVSAMTPEPQMPRLTEAGEAALLERLGDLQDALEAAPDPAVYTDAAWLEAAMRQAGLGDLLTPEALRQLRERVLRSGSGATNRREAADFARYDAYDFARELVDQRLGFAPSLTRELQDSAAEVLGGEAEAMAGPGSSGAERAIRHIDEATRGTAPSELPDDASARERVLSALSDQLEQNLGIEELAAQLADDLDILHPELPAGSGARAREAAAASLEVLRERHGGTLPLRVRDLEESELESIADAVAYHLGAAGELDSGTVALREALETIGREAAANDAGAVNMGRFDDTATSRMPVVHRGGNADETPGFPPPARGPNALTMSSATAAIRRSVLDAMETRGEYERHGQLLNDVRQALLETDEVSTAEDAELLASLIADRIWDNIETPSSETGAMVEEAVRYALGRSGLAGAELRGGLSEAAEDLAIRAEDYAPAWARPLAPPPTAAPRQQATRGVPARVADPSRLRTAGTEVLLPRDQLPSRVPFWEGGTPEEQIARAVAVTVERSHQRGVVGIGGGLQSLSERLAGVPGLNNSEVVTSAAQIAWREAMANGADVEGATAAAQQAAMNVARFGAAPPAAPPPRPPAPPQAPAPPPPPPAPPPEGAIEALRAARAAKGAYESTYGIDHPAIRAFLERAPLGGHGPGSDAQPRLRVSLLQHLRQGARTPDGVAEEATRLRTALAGDPAALEGAQRLFWMEVLGGRPLVADTQTGQAGASLQTAMRNLNDPATAAIGRALLGRTPEEGNAAFAAAKALVERTHRLTYGGAGTRGSLYRTRSAIGSASDTAVAALALDIITGGKASVAKRLLPKPSAARAFYDQTNALLRLQFLMQSLLDIRYSQFLTARVKPKDLAEWNNRFQALKAGLEGASATGRSAGQFFLPDQEQRPAQTPLGR